MLDVFRKHAYSKGTKILLGLLIVIFALFFGIPSYLGRSKAVASINCRTFLHFYTLPGCQNITPEQIDAEVGNIRKTLVNTYGENANQMLHGINLRQMALDQLIEQTLIEDRARNMGLRISDDDLAHMIESQTAFQIDGRFNVQRYNELLRANDLQPADFESDTRDRMLADLMRQVVINTVQLSSDEALHEFDRFGEKLSLAYIEFPYEDFTAGLNPTSAQVAKFYQENKEIFREPEKVQMTFVRYDPAVLAGTEQPSESDIEAFYEKNLQTMFTHPDQVRARHILIAVPPDASPQEKQAAKGRAEELLQKIKSGANFAALAKQFSNDPGTRDSGGELGFFKRGEMVKPFEDAAFSLKPGELTVVQSTYGYHVLQVEQVEHAHVDTIDEARAKIVTALKQKQGAEVAKQDVEQDLAAALEGRKLDELAKKRGLVAEQTGFVTANDRIKGAEDDPRFAKAVFAMNAGDVKAVTNGPAPFLVNVIKKEPSRIPPLNEITDKVRLALVRMTAESKARDAATAVLKQIKTPNDFEAIASTHHLQIRQTGDFPRATREVPGIGSIPGVTEAASALPSVPGIVDKVMENEGNSFIFKLEKRTPPSDDEWKAEGPAFTHQLLEQKRAAEWLAFVNEMKRQAYITVNPDVLGTSS